MHNPFSNKYRIQRSESEKKSHRKELLLGLLSGILIGLSYPPVPLPYLVFVGLIPYLLVINKRVGLAEINSFTYYTAFIFNLLTLYWVGGWSENSDTFLMIAGITLLFFNPGVFLIPSTIYYFAKKMFNGKIALLLLPFFWVTFEFAYSLTDFKFPWLTLGNSQPYFNTFIQIADIVGVYGLSLIILFSNVFMFFVVNNYFQRRVLNKTYLILFFVFLAIPLLYGSYVSKSYINDEQIKIGLIQPDFDPNNKWAGGNLQEQLNVYFDLSRKTIEHDAELIIWPETALPVYLLSGNYEGFVTQIKKFVDSNKVGIITGMPDANFYYNGIDKPEDAKPAKTENLWYTSYNSILGFTFNSNEIQKYGKMKLVPFGEKVPLVEHFPFFGDLIKWNVGISSWNTGKDTINIRVTTKSSFDTINVASIVCIESIYPEFVSQFVQRGADIIAVVTNDSWYGNSSGPYQHKEISVLRAVENRRSVVRAANGGISCLIDPNGITVAATNMFERTNLVVDVPIIKSSTFYSQNPYIIPIICSMITLFIIGLFLIKKLSNYLFNEG